MSLCVQNVFGELTGSDFLVPVPKHPNEMINGYNQAEKLTEVISSILGPPVSNALSKVKPTKMKSLSSRTARKVGVKGLYAFINHSSLDGKQVILVDDVTTSGSTVSECAQVLLNAGAKIVNVLVAGRDVFMN